MPKLITIDPAGRLSRRARMLVMALVLTAGIVFLRRFFPDEPSPRPFSVPFGVAAGGSTSEHSARVTGFSPAGGALVRLDDGRAIVVSLVEGIRDRCEVGSPVLVYLDDMGALLGWYLPDAGMGVVVERDRRRRRG
jgi:hypothetical protein